MKSYITLMQNALLLLLLNSCQSTRLAVVLPPTARYAAPPTPAAPTTAELPAAAEANEPEPVLSAAVSAAPEPAVATPRHLQAAPPPAIRLLPQAAPDTSMVRKPAAPTPDEIRTADRYTTVINVLGVLALLAGIASVIAGFSISGYAVLVLVPTGLLLVGISIPLLIFKSKNSTKSRLKARYQAERQTAKVAN